jgi:uncharacterized membrane protein
MDAISTAIYSNIQMDAISTKIYSNMLPRYTTTGFKPRDCTNTKSVSSELLHYNTKISFVKSLNNDILVTCFRIKYAMISILT